MGVFFRKILLIASISSFINLFVFLETTNASPLCYMIDELGQTIDLSYMCNQNTVNDNSVEDAEQRNQNGEERPILYRRTSVGEETVPEKTPEQPIQNVRVETLSFPSFSSFPSSYLSNSVDSYAKDYFVIRRTVGLDDVSSNFARNTSDRVSTQYVLNSRGQLEMRYYNIQD